VELAKDCMGISHIIRELGPVAFLKLLGSRIVSFNHYYVMRRSLAETQNDTLEIRRRAEMCPIGENDINEIEKSLAACNIEDKREILARLIFYRSGFKNCYVMRQDGKIAYMQWVIYPTENGIITERYRNKFYSLGDTQIMIENAFTFPPYRGLGYLQSGTLQLFEMARAKGYRSAMCYVRKDRFNTLNELSKIGFKITQMIPEYKFLGRVWRAL
jgi:hypothetical protein